MKARHGSRAGKVAWALAALLLAGPMVACGMQASESSTVSRSVVDGEPTDGFSGVVMYRSEGGLCSGTLLTRRVVLTAAHCMATVSDRLGWVFFGKQPDYRDVNTGIAVLHARRHPTYSPEGFGNDVAVLLLAEDAPADATPFPMLPADRAGGLVGVDARVVGFGETSRDQGLGTRRTGVVRITDVSGTVIGGAPNPSFICFGDSGGPLFVDLGGALHIAGIASTLSSRGGGSCDLGAQWTRVDAFRESFIQPFLEQVTPGTGLLGGRCYYEGNCGEGSCAESLGSTRIRYCSKGCSRDADCPGAMACLSDSSGGRRCHYPATLPELMGITCVGDDRCETGLCGRVVSGGVKVCTAACDPSAAHACPGGFSCRPNLAQIGSHACFAASAPPPSSGGCAARSPVGGAAGWSLWFVALVLLTRRRQRLDRLQ